MISFFFKSLFFHSIFQKKRQREIPPRTYAPTSKIAKGQAKQEFHSFHSRARPICPDESSVDSSLFLAELGKPKIKGWIAAERDKKEILIDRNESPPLFWSWNVFKKGRLRGKGICFIQVGKYGKLLRRGILRKASIRWNWGSPG